MVKKLQAVIVTTGKPYIPDPVNYPGCKTIEEMRAADQEQIDDCPDLVMGDPHAETKVEVRIIETEED